MDDLLATCPPPQAFEVINAGCSFVNGMYEFAGAMTPEGFAQRGADAKYVHKVPSDEKDGGGKTLMLFRCIMQSQQKRWFISEADEEHPGTDRDVDYYQHKQTERQDTKPPTDGWQMCDIVGIGPPPTLRPIGRMPAEEQHLAEWAIENRIIDIVLGDAIRGDCISTSLPFVRFVLAECEDSATIGQIHSSLNDKLHTTASETPTRLSLIQKALDFVGEDNDECLRLSLQIMNKVYPDSLRSADAHGRCALHHLLASPSRQVPDAVPEGISEHHVSLETLSLLVKAYPDVVNMPDPYTGWLPFHAAVMHNTKTNTATNVVPMSVDTLYHILRSFPSTIGHRSQYVGRKRKRLE